MEEVSSALASSLIRVFSSGDLRGFCDTTRIYRSLTNPFSNAIQHGKPMAPITVTVTVGVSTVTSAIQKWGPTIPADMLVCIFVPMLRVQAVIATELASTDTIGLGLYIAKEIVEAHGGTVFVPSTETARTVFTICLERGPIDLRRTASSEAQTT
jgi:signal transduction histidine kinase